MFWTEDMDRLLFSQRAQSPTATWPEIASVVSKKLGYLVSADAVGKRYNRIAREIAVSQSTPLFFDTEVDESDKKSYVNFRLGFYDIETTGLGAMFGRVLTVAVADEFGQVTMKSYDAFEGRNILDDSPLVEWAMKELDQYDILVSWNGKLFDKPFLNARAMKGLVVPFFPQTMHIDLMYQFKGQQARFGSAKMDNVAKALGVANQKTPLDFSVWEKAAVGDKDALRTVEEHCKADVLVLRDIFARSKRLIGTITR